MATNLYFELLDNCSNLLTGSLVQLRAFQPPYFTGSNSTLQGTFGGPVKTYSDNTGTAHFYNVISGIYELKYSAANANNPAIYVKYADTVTYINVPDLSGSTVNGLNYVINNPIGSFNGFNFISASYAQTATNQSQNYVIPIIQAGSSSLNNISQSIITFANQMPNTNYSVNMSLSGSWAPLQWFNKTITGFTSSISGSVTAILNWHVISNTQ